MLPFQNPGHFAPLASPYPVADDLASALTNMTSQHLAWLFRLWVTEGTPYVFRSSPAVYEAMRDWLSRRVGVSAKEITVIGSARLGFSLTPIQYGKQFTSDSDLDLSIISGRLFERLVRAFEKWKGELEAGTLQVDWNDPKYRFWPDNLKLLPQNIARGFIDAWKIPNRYHDFGQLMYQLKVKLESTNASFRVRHASTRIYRDWESFHAVQCRNLALLACAKGATLSTTDIFLRLQEPRMTGHKVRELQRLLDRVGIRVRQDGVFGLHTEAAVREFQQTRSLNADGVVGPITFAALQRERVRAVANTDIRRTPPDMQPQLGL